MTIKTSEYWIDEPFEQIALKIQIDTRQVKFGIFNAFEKSFEKYPRPWIGEINTRKKTFKLFRTKGSDNTSDLSVIGSYTTRGAKPVVVVKHRIHFTVIFGALGLLLFAIAAFYLLHTKGIMVPPTIQAIVFSMVIVFYLYTIGRDLCQDEKQLEKTLMRELTTEDSDVEEMADDDEDSCDSFLHLY